MQEFSGDLIDDLAHRSVVLFLGSGVSASSTLQDGSRMKTWDSFLREILSELPPITASVCEKFLDEERYLEACEVIKEAIEIDEWDRRCEAEFFKSAKYSSLHEALVKLDQRLVVTTNFDKLYESAWSAINAGLAYFPGVTYVIDRDIFSTFRSNRSHIIKLHGSIDDLSSMVFSYSDYAKKAFGNSEYQKFLDLIFIKYTVLFVGFSMKDPAIRSVLQRYAANYPKGRPHYIFTPENPSPEEERIEKRFNKLTLIKYDKSDGHKELVEKLRRLNLEVLAKRKEYLADELRSLGAT